MLRRTGVVVAVLVVLAGCGGGGSTVPESRLSSLVLKQGDLPAGFQLFDKGPQAQIDNQGTTRFNPTRFGREGGWITRYRRTGSLSKPGPLIVESRADLFKSAGGAKKDVALYDVDFGRTLATSSGRRLPPPGVGDAAVAYTAPQLGLKPMRVYRIAWRDHNATASVLIQGYQGRIGLADALELARRQDGRIRRAAG